MLGFISALRDAFGQTEAANIASDASKKAQATVDSVKLSDAEDLYKKGRAAAGVAASDKAGIAKRQAKAAAAMNNASKTMSAIQGAQAATDAVQQGYDAASQNAASMQAGQEAKELAKAQTKAGIQQHEGDVAAQEAMNNTNKAWNTVGTFAKLLG